MTPHSDSAFWTVFSVTLGAMTALGAWLTWKDAREKADKERSR